MKTYTHLQPEELSVICALRKLCLSCTAIAVQLKRAPSTISRECRRMALLAPLALQTAPTPVPYTYTVRAAQRDRAEKRRASAGNARRWRPGDAIFQTLKAGLAEQHSLAQALGGLRREREAVGPVPAHQRLPSRSTLYRLAQPLGWFNREHYPSLRLRRYHTKPELRARADRAPNGWVARCPSVDQRPVELTARARPLYMEIDTIVGRKTDCARLVVAVCRRTRFTLIGHLKHCTAAAVEKWLRARMQELRLPLVALIPDQGSEFARLPNIKSLTVYPCQPHRPWQKPTVENTNGLIRHYVPKAALISNITPEFVSYVPHQLNHRPRRCLNWETPAALLSRLLPAVAL
jgi:transposase, IS30 family